MLYYLQGSPLFSEEVPLRLGYKLSLTAHSGAPPTFFQTSPHTHKEPTAERPPETIIRRREIITRRIHPFELLPHARRRGIKLSVPRLCCKIVELSLRLEAQTATSDVAHQRCTLKLSRNVLERAVHADNRKDSPDRDSVSDQ